jgi:hypothetical protein
MPNIEERIAQLEYKVGPTPVWEQRLQAVEKAAHSSEKKDVWDILQAIGTVFSGVVVLAVGWWLNDTVDQALEQKKVELEYVTEMRDLLVASGKPDTPQEVADANAVALAAYGEEAIGPLMYRLASGLDVSALAAEKGLRLLGFSHREAVCGRLNSVLLDRVRNYTWLTDQYVIRLMADLNCIEQWQTLVDYKASLEDATFGGRLSESMPVDGEAIGKLREELARSLDVLRPTQ